MGERKRLFLLVLIMTTVSIVVAGITVYVLYGTAFEQQRERLVEAAQSQARLIEAIARFDAARAQTNPEFYPGGPTVATLSQIIDAHGHYKGFGETGEFTLARRTKDNIFFLLRHRHFDLDQPKSVPLDSELAEPMRRALSGLSGTVIGLDYRGETVLAAHEPVAELGFGIVAKIDLVEIRAPFIRAGLMAICAALLVVFVGAVVFLRVSNPIMKRLEERTAELSRTNQQLGLQIQERKEAEEALRKAHSELEQRVQERTAELLQANEQLQQEIEERKRAEEASGQTEEKYRLLVQNIPSIVYKGYPDWSVELFDKKIESLIGYSVDDFHSQRLKWSDLIVEEDFEAVRESFIQALKTDKSYVREYKIRTEAGNILWIQDRGHIICDDNGEIEYVSGVFFDITDHKRAEEEQALLRRRLEALWAIARMTDASHQKLCDRVLTEILDLTQSRYAFYGFFNEDESMMTLHSWSEEALESCQVIDKPLHFPIMEAGIWAEAVRERRILIINDYKEDHSKKKGLPEGHVPLSRLLVVPVFSYDRIVALAAVANKSTDYKEEDARQVDAFTTNVQVIMESQQSREALTKSEEELRILSSQLLSAQEQERGRIARELHDGIGQSLSAIKFRLEDALGQMGEDIAESSVISLNNLIPIIQSTVEEVRRITMDLRPSTLDDLGILATIGWFCREFKETYATVRIEKEIGLEEADIPESLKTVIYRVLQEALNNVAKHSGADSVTVSLTKKDDTIELTIEDNGRGFDLNEVLDIDSSKRGFGLGSMKERIELSGGSFALESTRREGTNISASWQG
jgi:PAS domain S-box-containing protein